MNRSKQKTKKEKAQAKQQEGKKNRIMDQERKRSPVVLD